MPSLVFMLWQQDLLSQVKELNLGEGTGWNEMEMGSAGRRVKRPCEWGESSPTGDAVNLTRAADRKNTVHLDLMSSYSKVRSQQIPA